MERMPHRWCERGLARRYPGFGARALHGGQEGWHSMTDGNWVPSRVKNASLRLYRITKGTLIRIHQGGSKIAEIQSAIIHPADLAIWIVPPIDRALIGRWRLRHARQQFATLNSAALE